MNISISYITRDFEQTIFGLIKTNIYILKTFSLDLRFSDLGADQYEFVLISLFVVSMQVFVLCKKEFVTPVSKINTCKKAC